ncbi:S-layer homology domain-containing protein [Paenibacillus sedimenti]|uniref:S-layer homology domain-containing protein n=1 Tax=Paenibacillus sedimenti TaxID=2770274 RepID=A0A926KUM8_9BACL|nr:S-layer homology domain-containing protein [Paenibacillus sedimenti]MBD0382454.1 S-layer homology domain-containing protein [Paenibacillus sedimenti]
MDKQQKLKKISKIVLHSTVLTNLIAGSAPAAFAETTPALPVQSDLDQASQDAKAALLKAIQKGLLEGDSEGRIQPTGQMTRLQAVALIARTLGLKTDVTTTSNYRDVSTDSWGLPYLEALTRVGIIEGDDNGTFRPNDPLSKEELAVLLVRITQTNVTGKGKSLAIKDANAVSDWAKPYVQAALELGLLSTDASGAFAPKSNATREHVAVTVTQMTEKPEFNGYKDKITVLFDKGNRISNSDPAA